MPKLDFQNVQFPGLARYISSWPDINPNVAFDFTAGLVNKNQGNDYSGAGFHDVFSRYSVTMYRNSIYNYEVQETLFSEDSTLVLPTTFEEGTTIYHWDFSPERTYRTTFVFIGTWPLWLTQSTNSPWTWEELISGSYTEPNGGVLASLGLDQYIDQELYNISEVENKRYTPGGVLIVGATTVSGKDVNNKVPTFYHENEIIEVKTLLRPVSVAFVASVGNIGGIISAFGDSIVDPYTDGVYLSSGSPGFVLVRNGVTKQVPYSFSVRKKYITTTLHKMDRLQFRLEDESGVLVEEELLQDKYAIKTREDHVDYIGPAGGTYIEEILVRGY